MNTTTLNTKKAGFSLVELTIVVVILGVLATFAVPRFQSSVEKTKVASMYANFAQIEGLFARKLATDGTYMGPSWDMQLNPWFPEGFRYAGLRSSNWETKWEVTVYRDGPSSGFGRYKIVWDEKGFNKSKSTVPKDLLPPGQ